MVARARQGKVRRGYRRLDLSISNLGMFNVEHFIAIINPPGSGCPGWWGRAPSAGW